MRIREAVLNDVPGIARVHVDSWRTAYRDILPDSFLDELTYESREERWRERLAQAAPQQVMLVVEDASGRLVGFAYGGPERDATPGYDGEIYAIYLLAERRRQGIGRQLMAASAAALQALGYHALLVWVLEANGPARAFYEALGGRLIGSKPITIGPADLVEVSYGWRDLVTFGSAADPGPDH
jgi:ribosomal protein S18 acetylase RimI-like enzyme